MTNDALKSYRKIKKYTGWNLKRIATNSIHGNLGACTASGSTNFI